MARLRSALEIKVSLPFLASPENASIPGTSVPHNNLIEPDCVIYKCRSLQIWFEVQQGEIFGLLGPNGAGKTSTLEVLEGLRSSDGGDLRIMGVDPTRESRKLRNLIGVQLQTSGLPGSMRVDAAMRFFSAYHAVAPNYQLLNRLGLSEKIGTQYHMLSTSGLLSPLA